MSMRSISASSGGPARRGCARSAHTTAGAPSPAISWMPAADLNTVKELLRHVSVQTTAKYDRRGERLKQDAADLLHFPHVRFRGASP